MGCDKGCDYWAQTRYVTIVIPERKRVENVTFLCPEHGNE